MASGVQELLWSALPYPPTTRQRSSSMPLAPAAQTSLTKWQAMIAENNFRDLPSIIAAHAVFRSPVGLKPYTGRDPVCLCSAQRRVFSRISSITANSLMVKTPRWSSAHILATKSRRPSSSSASTPRANRKVGATRGGRQSPRQGDGRVDRAASESVTCNA
jgi:hypothetical protein